MVESKATSGSRRAVGTAAGLIVLLLLVAGIRGMILPARSVAVFLEYEHGSSWRPAPENPLFENGQLDFAGYEPVQLGGDDLGTWDEVVIMSFDLSDDYQEFVSRLQVSDIIARHHVMDIAPQAPELLAFMNWRLRSYRNDESIDPGESVPIEEVIRDPSYLKQWRYLFDGEYRQGIVMLNLLSHADNPSDPAGRSDVSAEELYERYSEKATRVLGKLGGQILVLGSVDRVVEGPKSRHYDVYAFVFYPSVDVFEIMFTARERVEAQVYQRAGLSASGSAGYWVKPYREFVPEAR